MAESNSKKKKTITTEEKKRTSIKKKTNVTSTDGKKQSIKSEKKMTKNPKKKISNEKKSTQKKVNKDSKQGLAQETKKSITREKDVFKTKEVICLILATCIVSLIMGIALARNFSFSKELTLDDNLRMFIKNYHYVLENSISDVKGEDLIKDAMAGMLGALDDDYSAYMDENQKENFNINLAGEYTGIGIEILSTEKGNQIINVYDNSPAEEAGLKKGDFIKQVDDMKTDEKTVTDIADYIKKGKKETFTITVLRENEEVKVTVKRKKITLTSVDSKIIKEESKKIGYIYISIFSNVSYKQFKENLEKLEKSKIDSLIIDVRDNNGGQLSVAHNILSLFLDSSHVIYQTEKQGVKTKFYSKGKTTKKYPIVILQNQNSASASEMLSGALKEEYGALIVGEYSYGKGTIQELITLPDDSEYKFTTKKWLTPKGNWINKKGVEPDYTISLNEKYYKDPTEKNDNQFQKALEVIKKEGK